MFSVCANINQRLCYILLDITEGKVKDRILVPPTMPDKLMCVFCKKPVPPRAQYHMSNAMSCVQPTIASESTFPKHSPLRLCTV